MGDVSEIRFYDRAGQPLPDLETFGRLSSDRQYTKVARDVLDVPGARPSEFYPLPMPPGTVRVLTTWIGIDQQEVAGGPPLIFETRVFGGDHDGYRALYPTSEEAREGHRRLVEHLRRSGEASPI